MVDTEQVERLKRSTEEWNLWREEQPEVQPDLSRADLNYANLSDANLNSVNFRHADLSRATLSHADLSHVDLSRVDLSGADLRGAVLKDANLSYANLSYANLRQATLNRATLRHADLSSTDLRGADLSGASLFRTNLTSAQLGEADFSQTHFACTILAWTDLSEVSGLQTATHDGPSVVDIHSVTLPDDEQTRLHFLYGVGWTSTQIEYLPSLLTPRPIKYSSLFISYAHQDEALAQRLHTDLRRRDVSCWFAPHDLVPGQLIRECIDQAIQMQDKLLLILSESSVKSGWVRLEVETALAREVREQREILFPIRIDDAVFHCKASWACSLRNHRHIGDFRQWANSQQYQKVFLRLLGDLKTRI